MTDPTNAVEVVTLTSRDLALLLAGAAATLCLVGCLIAGVLWRRDRAINAALDQLEREALGPLVTAARNREDEALAALARDAEGDALEPLAPMTMDEWLYGDRAWEAGR